MTNHLDNPLIVGDKKYVDMNIARNAMCACHNTLLQLRKLNNPLLVETEKELQLAIDLLVGRKEIILEGIETYSIFDS